MNPEDLPLTPELVHRLNAWAFTFDSFLNEEDPSSGSIGFSALSRKMLR